MKDIPVFDTETGVSTLVLKEIPYKQIAYVKVQSVQPSGLKEHLRECVSFCRMCGAERIFATGHPELNQWPLHCIVIPMACGLSTVEEPPANLFPVTEQTAARWRTIYNERMAAVDNAATQKVAIVIIPRICDTLANTLQQPASCGISSLPST